MLSQASGYAVTALGFLATQGGKPLLVKEMATACDIPSSYLAKIVNTLARRRIVNTQRGIGGGVTLASEPQDLPLYAICEALDDPILHQRCMLGTAECSDDRACPAHSYWKPHRLQTVQFLKDTSLADIAAFESKRRRKPKPSK